MPEVWELPGALDGERLDRAVALLSGASRREANDLLDAGRVSIGGRVAVSHSRRVRTGEIVSLDSPLPPRRQEVPAADAGVDVPVVWSDDQVIVVDKPAGMVVHPGAGNRAGTLVHGLVARFPDLAGLAEAADPPEARLRPGIVHRLDKGTSGLLMVARTPAARAELASELARRQVGREYLTLVLGEVESDAGLIDAPIGRSDRDPTRMRLQAGGRPARTRYQVEARHDLPVPTTLLRCHLDTGRTHQIRVHLASIGHPVVGDDRYGPKRIEGGLSLPPGRVFLHAAVLSFDHPVSRERLSFSSPLPEDLAGVLDRASHSGSS
jgi:23S rRNA pseudouridine1911/1915/1917 synthase